MTGAQVATDDSGNVYTVGQFSLTSDFDPGAGILNITSSGNFDGFIQKMDASGNLLWAHAIGGTDYDYINSISLDGSGNPIIVGGYTGTVDFDPGAGVTSLTTANYDSYILKLDASGDFQWVKPLSSDNYVEASFIQIDANNNLLVSGYFEGTADFDPGAGSQMMTANGNSDVFTLKLNATGDYLWARILGNSTSEEGISTFDAQGNVYTTGHCSGTLDFDPGAGTTMLTGPTGMNTFIQKLDANGNFLWAKVLESNNWNAGKVCRADASGDVFIVGKFSDTTDFDPGAGVFTVIATDFTYDVYVLKLDQNGNFIWAKTYGGNGTEVARGAVLDANGNIYITGEFASTVDFDPGPGVYSLTEPGNNFFVQKLNNNGEFMWVDGIHSNSGLIAYGLANNSSGFVYLTGYFQGTTDFNPGAGVDELTPTSSACFVLKLSQCSVNVGTTTSGLTITADEANATYQWIDCDNGNTAISGATNQSYTATANGNYAVIVTSNGCSDTSDCTLIDIVGINNLAQQLGINVYPNPFGDEFSIDWKGYTNESSMSIHSADGRLVASYETIQNEHSVIPTSDWVPGVYFVSLKEKDNQIVIRVMKD